LQFDDITDERLVNESQKLKLFREAVLSTAGSHRSVNSRKLKVAYGRIPFLLDFAGQKGCYFWVVATFG